MEESDSEIPKGYTKIEPVEDGGSITVKGKPYGGTGEGAGLSGEQEASSGKLTYTLSIPNGKAGEDPGYALPSSGGPGTHLLTILGLLLACGAGTLLWRRYRRSL